MRLPMKNKSYFILKIKLLSSLIMMKIGNKKSTCESCRCSVIEIMDFKSKKTVYFEPINANSLNQIFFLASMQFRKDNRSHTANIYEWRFLKGGSALEYLRF